jgi:hypothetical protein
VISWGAQGGAGGAFAPPACMLKKALDLHHDLVEFSIKSRQGSHPSSNTLPSIFSSSGSFLESGSHTSACTYDPGTELVVGDIAL